MGELIVVIAVIVALVVAYKLVEYCYARFPLQYSIFLIVAIVLKFFLCRAALNDFGTCFAFEFIVAFFYITQVQANDYDTIETTATYNSWRDAYDVSSERVHHHIPGWVRKLLFMAIFAGIAAWATWGLAWGGIAVLVVESILPALRALGAWNAIKNNQNQNKP